MNFKEGDEVIVNVPQDICVKITKVLDDGRYLGTYGKTGIELLFPEDAISPYFKRKMGLT